MPAGSMLQTVKRDYNLKRLLNRIKTHSIFKPMIVNESGYFY